MINLSSEVQQRLQTEANIWLTSVRPDGRPHLVPVWFAWSEGKLYTCIQSGSIKARNLAHNPQLSLALEDGSKVVICQGVASVVPPPWPEAVVTIFQEKYEWNIISDGEYDQLLEITPQKWLVW